MIIRVTTAERVNEIINDPSVRPTVGGEGYLDLTATCADPANYVLLAEHGCCVLMPVLHGLPIYESHTNVLPAGRGAWMLRMGREMLRWMFTRTAAFEVCTVVPTDNRAASTAVAISHWRREWVRPEAALWSVTIQEWISRAAEVEETGAWLHNRMAELGMEATHDPDANHNRYVGAALEMARGGHVGKGVQFYNRWAFTVRAPKLTLESMDPVIVGFPGGRLRLEEDGNVTCP